jgi:hypothetical protein
MIHNVTEQLKLIDLDSSCVSDEDCSDKSRYSQHESYAIPIQMIDENTLNVELSKRIDWYSVGMICIQLLTVHNYKTIEESTSELDKINKNIHESNDYFDLLLSLSSLVYPQCSIHDAIYQRFCELCLVPCIEGIIKVPEVKEFYDTHFNRSKSFVIESEALSGKFYGFVFTRIFEHIITHAFMNKNIYIHHINDEEDFYKTICSQQRVEFRSKPKIDMVVRGSHYWQGDNCDTPYDFNRTTIDRNILPIEKRCKPENPYQDAAPYHVPSAPRTSSSNRPARGQESGKNPL